MSLSSSISNALSGLGVTSRSAQLVSSNLANALNENYSRQEIEISSASIGGAIVTSVNRFVDAALLSDKRNAQAELGMSSERADSASAIERAIGTPDDPSSIGAHLERFDAAIRYLESDPNSEVRLRETVSTSVALAARLNTAENNIQSERLSADRQIGVELKTLNTNLQKIDQLNEHIVAANVNDRDANAFLDERQKLIDEVSEIVPVREMQRDKGAISLVTANGMMLIDDSAISFDFTTTNIILPHMTSGNGLLGSIERDGQVIDLSSDSGPLSGGRLQGLFEVRDETAPKAQENLDAFALDLAERFHDLPGDLGAGTTAPGLFTDGGTRVDAANEVGLAGRLQLNANVDPDQGGALWRLQSGTSAASQSSAGYTSFISDMIASLEDQSTASGSIFGHSASLTSYVSQVSSDAEQSQSFASARYEQLNLMQLENGVDTDTELQKLLSIEMNYAANAKVIQTIDQMLSTIMGIN